MLSGDQEHFFRLRVLLPASAPATDTNTARAAGDAAGVRGGVWIIKGQFKLLPSRQWGATESFRALAALRGVKP